MLDLLLIGLLFLYVELLLDRLDVLQHLRIGLFTHSQPSQMVLFFLGQLDLIVLGIFLKAALYELHLLHRGFRVGLLLQLLLLILLLDLGHDFAHVSQQHQQTLQPLIGLLEELELKVGVPRHHLHDFVYFLVLKAHNLFENLDDLRLPLVLDRQVRSLFGARFAAH